MVSVTVSHTLWKMGYAIWIKIINILIVIFSDIGMYMWKKAAFTKVKTMKKFPHNHGFVEIHILLLSVKHI